MPDPEKQLFPETPAELYGAMMHDKAKIYCSNVEERREVLQALHDEGYQINSASLRYLPESYTDFSYPHPGFDGEDIACFRSWRTDENWIRPDDVLFALGVGERPYVPDAEWFSSSLDELFETVR